MRASSERAPAPVWPYPGRVISLLFTPVPEGRARRVTKMARKRKGLTDLEKLAACGATYFGRFGVGRVMEDGSVGF